MKISLIDNGLDSLTKGYTALRNYEELKIAGTPDAKRFGVLKDAILSLQHGIEILFKCLLRDQNEVLLFSEVNTKLKAAYQRRKKGEIAELFEAEGVHTVGFRESVERVNDILGIELDDRLKRILWNIEKWRNGIIHSAVVLNENEVSNVLNDAMRRLDAYFGASIGKPYLSGLGRQELDRAYRLFEAVHGRHKNTVKAGVISRLIAALADNGIRDVKSPDVLRVDDPEKAFSVLQSMVGDEARYGCDFINHHCSGDARVTDLKGREMTIHCADINVDYRFEFDGLLVFVPQIEDDLSPLIFIYSAATPPLTSAPDIREHKGFKTQGGFLLDDTSKEIWTKTSCDAFNEEIHDEGRDSYPAYKALFRFLSQGLMCFMNVQTLAHGRVERLLYERKHDDIHRLQTILSEIATKPV